MRSVALILALLLHWFVSGALAHANAIARLDEATVIGTTSDGVESFLGIPYAAPPINDLRFRLPQPIKSYTGTLDATSYGDQCMQEDLQLPAGLPDTVAEIVRPLFARISGGVNMNQSEDCLHINVVRPENVSEKARLPVLVWIYGGGFSYGSNAVPEYNGSAVVKRSIELGQPLIWVALNYRLNVFGFLGGEQVKRAGVGNLGLQDQRTALRWVHKHIASFGGDPAKVTIWGESAGSDSVFAHMATNGGNTEGLFRAAMMSSGSAVPTGDISDIQDIYEFVTSAVGCSKASDSLACLRGVSAESLSTAASNVQDAMGFNALYAYMPRADGVFLTEPPQRLILDGQVAHIPYIIGDTKDEGTLFAIASLNVTTDQQFADFVSQQWFPGSNVSDLQSFLKLYPSDPASGSPFDTGDANALTPQYKRISAGQGDWRFHAPRRLLLNGTSKKGNAYSFLYARGGLPDMGVVHTSDLSDALGPGDMTDYFVRFVNHLNPNGGDKVHWPPYDTASRLVLQFNDGSTPLNVTVDDERLAGMEELTKLTLRFPL